MTSTYFIPLLTKPTIIDTTGKYRTRRGEIVVVFGVSTRHDLGCRGLYADGVREYWHKSGRIYAGVESMNDIVEKVE